MSQTELQRILSAVRALFSRFYGTAPDVTDPSSIVLMSQQLLGFMHEIALDLTRSDNRPWIVETIEDIPIDEGRLSDAVAWLNEADEEVLRKPSNLAIETCYILANG